MYFDVLDYYIQMYDKKILLYYKGHFNKEALFRLSNYIRHKFTTHEKTGRKLFAIFIELAKNISHYSFEKHINLKNKYADKQPLSIGVIVIHEEEDYFVITAGNLASSKDVETILKNCQQINGLNLEELRSLKREVLGKPLEEGQKGGNIGLIQIAIRSGCPLEIKTKPVANSELTYFILSTKIIKSKA